MRIVVSGTHGSGKSTLIADFHAAHPHYRVLGDPFEDLDLDDPSSEASFAAQLRLTAARLEATADATDVIAERGPLDFLAYLTALDRLGRSGGSLLARATQIVERSLATVDLVAVVPLDAARPIRVPAEEDPELREAMDDVLLELLDDLEQDGAVRRSLVITGDPVRRLQALSDAVR
ncbi:ATP-binding protein [Microbacterium sp. SSW1-49]|uniref:ATP-binding protein n=1 Tax=Microbacterium croceum TaxID=2851645 RepID=A0ABT0FIN2_9MICO|nr:AAA family ATPase [Microbacterium croceum]MCK2037926.1 ATP-binding protein [Microbacterium croceum]